MNPSNHGDLPVPHYSSSMETGNFSLHIYPISPQLYSIEIGFTATNHEPLPVSGTFTISVADESKKYSSDPTTTIEADDAETVFFKPGQSIKISLKAVVFVPSPPDKKFVIIKWSPSISTSQVVYMNSVTLSPDNPTSSTPSTPSPPKDENNRKIEPKHILLGIGILGGLYALSKVI